MTMSFPNWKRLLEISPESWLIAAATALAAYLLLYGALRFIGGRVGVLAERRDSPSGRIVAEVLQSTNRFVILLVALLIGLRTIELTPAWETWQSHGWVVVIGVQAALWANRAISAWLRGYHARSDDADLRNRATTTTLALLLRALLWLTITLAILANLGVNITALVASLGIGGIAVALGLQTILSDLFASLAIALDKPFVAGDFITFGNNSGTVTRVGIKTTRIQSESGETIIISNTELLKQIVRNYRPMRQRRVVFSFRIAYQAPVEQLAELTQALKEIVDGIEQVRFGRAHFKSFGESALEYEVVYFVLNPDYNLYMDIQQHINLELMRACAARQVQFGYPVRSVQVAADAALGAAPPK